MSKYWLSASHRSLDMWTLPGGSWVVVSGVISPLIWAIRIVTPLRTAHEPPSIEY